MVISSRKHIVADQVRLADTFFRRFKGLMGVRHLEPGEGLLLKNCSSIHSFFMKIMIDAVYLSNDLTVLHIETLPPWRIGKYVKGAKHVLEIAKAPTWLSVGDTLTLTASRIEQELKSISGGYRHA